VLKNKIEREEKKKDNKKIIKKEKEKIPEREFFWF
jgi:hypothetical protein